MSSDLSQPIQQPASPRRELTMKVVMKAAATGLVLLLVGLWVWHQVSNARQGDLLMAQMNEVGPKWVADLKNGRWQEVHAACTRDLRSRMPPQAWQALVQRHPGLKEKLFVRGFDFSGGGVSIFRNVARVIFRWESEPGVKPPVQLEVNLVMEDGQAHVGNAWVNGEMVKP